MSVDSSERLEAMRGRWGLPFEIHSDPGGESFLRPLDLWNPDERGGIALPAILVISPEGAEHFRVTSRDFADRIHDDDAFEALAGLDWSPLAIDPVPVPEAPDPELQGVFRTTMFNPYFRGNFYAAVAIQQRVADDAARLEARSHRLMAKSFLDAWKEWRDRDRGSRG